MTGAVNFAEAKNYEPVSGTFDAVVIQGVFVPASKSSGKPAVALHFTLTDPEVEGRKVKTTSSLSPEGMWKTKEYLVAMGADPEDVEGNIPDIEAFIGELAGNNVRLVLSVGSYTDTQTGVARATQQVDAVKSAYDV